MNDKKRRLKKLERAANTDKVRVVVCWAMPGEELSEPEQGHAVIVLEWPEDC